MEKKKLFEEFPPVSTQQWEEVIVKDLKGADYEKKLVWKTIDGIKVKPYFRQEHLDGKQYLEILPGNFPYTRGIDISNEWEIRQDIIIDNIEDANHKAVDALKKGANAVAFSTKNITPETQSQFSALLKGVNLEKHSVHFISGATSLVMIKMLIEEIAIQNLDKTNVKGSFTFDPIGSLSRKGKFYQNENADFASLKDALVLVKEALPGLRILAISGNIFNNAGSSVVQELGYSLSVANEYVSRLITAGLKAEDILSQMHFTLAIGSSYFLEIAKLRAARMLFAGLASAYNCTSDNASKIQIPTITSSWHKTMYDPFVNLLRTTTESMAAAIGGTGSHAVKPYDLGYKISDDFSERIARNQQIILKEESFLDKVVDPASGSYYIENLTDAVAEETWRLVIEIENKGGFITAFKTGHIQEEIKKTANLRDLNIATRKEILLGTNQFANQKEKMADKFTLFNCLKKNNQSKDAIAEPLRQYRGAEAFEMLRMKTEKAAKTPKVFLLTIGNLVMRKARAGFASNFFACAGFSIIDNLGFSSMEEGAKACINSQADICVLCSSDDEYTDLVPQFVEKLNGKMQLVLAGYPKAQIDSFKVLGLNNYIYAGCNVLETLQHFQKELGI